jgi:hypothetical protein
MVSRRRESLAGRIDLLIAAMDRLGVRLERASRGPSLATGPVKRMFDASHNEAATATTPATLTAPEDVIDPSRAPVSTRGFATIDVEEHRLCIVPPERSSYIRSAGKPGRYEHVWTDGSVTPSAFSDGGLKQCLLSPDWELVYEPRARELVGLPALAELDHCRDA